MSVFSGLQLVVIAAVLERLWLKVRQMDGFGMSPLGHDLPVATFPQSRRSAGLCTRQRSSTSTLRFAGTTGSLVSAPAAEVTFCEVGPRPHADSQRVYVEATIQALAVYAYAANLVQYKNRRTPFSLYLEKGWNYFLGKLVRYFSLDLQK